jgi:type IV secretory pathway VirB4 component
VDNHPLHHLFGLEPRLNPLDVTADLHADEAIRRRSLMVGALLATVLGRPLSPFEEALLGSSVEDASQRIAEPTLHDVARALAVPTERLTKQFERSASELVRESEALRLTLDKLLHRTLKGMFDGKSTVDLSAAHNGIVVDLSKLQHQSDALACVMVAVTSWLQSIMTGTSTRRRIQVLDEAWSLLAFEQAARYLQSCLKLGRSYGVANLVVIHRLSDLRSQSDDGASSTKIASGLLADAQTRVLFRQASDQLSEARQMLNLNAKETDVLGRLVRGRSIWKIGERVAVVAHDIRSDERGLCDTDQRMRSASA